MSPTPAFAALSGLFVGFGVGHAYVGRPLPAYYVLLLLFFTLKVIFGYRKCTVAYAECKIRGVPREQGYVNMLLDGVVDVRGDLVVLLLLLCAVGAMFALRARAEFR
jgi:hypothetical protein